MLVLFNPSLIVTEERDKLVRQLVVDNSWLDAEFHTILQQHGFVIIKERKLSNTFSVACDHICDWVLGKLKGTWVSMDVYSDGSYDVPPTLSTHTLLLMKMGVVGVLDQYEYLVRSDQDGPEM
jgi:hypothetical protein